MEIFTSSSLIRRRENVAQALQSLIGPQDLLLVFCGDPIQKPGGLDQTYDFLPHPEYLWLTGSRRASGIVAYSQKEGWIDFVRPVSEAEILWEGGREKSFGQDLDHFENWLKTFSPSRIFVLGQPNRAQTRLQLAVTQDEWDQVQEAVNRVRRRKDAEEIQLIRTCAQMAQVGYEAIRNLIRPGVTERDIQIAYEAAVLRAGAEKFPYGTIVGAGTNSAVLHAVPTSREIKSGDLILIDAGADVADYGVDITRVFSATGLFDSRQKEIYEIVLAAQTSAIERAQPGVEWFDVHRCAARRIAEGLKDLKLVKGSIDSLTESGAVSVFFPHGVGHMVGLRVRDVGPRVPLRPRECCGVRVRVDFPLEEDFIMTVEPGLYFIPALLDHPETRRKYADFIEWTAVADWMDFGGIRLEDDIRIAAMGAENLTALVAK